ncbi:MAG TPA: arginine--tRNA ligase [Flavobacteriales bacterium]|nr:arginine--tRNA ligase [Flavobacteriales bacterium]
MKLEALLLNATIKGLKGLFDVQVPEKQINFQKTRKDFKGDITLLTFPFASLSRKSPEETGEILGAYFVKNIDEVASFNVIKGFLNLEISDSYWLNFLKSIFERENYGIATPKSGKTIMIEYSQPNTNKPLHLGHLRNNMLGYSLANILKANGHKVIMANIINDRGIHICKSMLAWQKWGNGETPESSDIKGDKLVGRYYVEFDKNYKKEIRELMEGGMDEEEASKKAPLIIEAQEMLQKWEAGDYEIKDLWKTMNSWVLKGFDQTYDYLGVSFDELYYESDTYLLGKAHVNNGLKDGIFYKKEDGSIWCDLSEYNLDPKLLLRSDGTSVYITQDIGTAIQRFEDYSLDRQIYVVGDEQIHHFKVLFAILKKLGYSWADSNYHLSYGMVELPSGKMKSREGTIVDADDIMEEMVQSARRVSEELGKLDDKDVAEKDLLYKQIGLGALKYFLTRVDPKKTMLFNPEESIDFNGNTGPFIQYTFTRINSLLKKANGSSTDLSDAYLPNAKEKNLIKLICQFPEIIVEAGESLSPAIIANYCYELAKEFNNFYQAVPILKDEDRDAVLFRLALSKVTRMVIKTGMNLLGIEMPERM